MISGFSQKIIYHHQKNFSEKSKLWSADNKDTKWRYKMLEPCLIKELFIFNLLWKYTIIVNVWFTPGQNINLWSTDQSNIKYKMMW